MSFELTKPKAYIITMLSAVLLAGLTATILDYTAGGFAGNEVLSHGSIGLIALVVFGATLLLGAAISQLVFANKAQVSVSAKKPAEPLDLGRSPSVDFAHREQQHYEEFAAQHRDEPSMTNDAIKHMMRKLVDDNIEANQICVLLNKVTGLSWVFLREGQHEHFVTETVNAARGDWDKFINHMDALGFEIQSFAPASYQKFSMSLRFSADNTPGSDSSGEDLSSCIEEESKEHESIKEYRFKIKPGIEPSDVVAKLEAKQSKIQKLINPKARTSASSAA